MKTLNLIQGTESWHAARAKCFTASEAPAMLGLSKYMTRNDLLKQKATGMAPEIDAATQRRFDAGHAAEELARSIAERIIGEDLFPITGSSDVEGMPLLASFDGLTMCEDICWENKLWNDCFAQIVRDGDVPDTHWPQLEQQLLVSGASKVLFTVSDGTEEKTVSTWYASQFARRAALLAGWKQFAADLANYQHAETAPDAVAAPQMQLPTVSVQVSGSIALISNLDKFGEALTEYVAKINKKPQTDQDFADLEATVKTLKAAEDALESAESNALAQTASIDDMRRAVALYRDTARSNRLLVEKLVKAEKENRKNAIAQAGKDAFAQHIDSLNTRIGKPYMPAITVDFAAAIRSLKSMTSIQNAVDTALANGKIEADAIANKITANLLALREHAEEFKFLFADTAQLISKETDDLIAVIKSRIAEHKAAEEKRIEAERERIRAEEVAKLAREQASKEAAEKREAERIERETQTKSAADAKVIADQQAAEAKARDQAESAKPVPAVTPAPAAIVPALAEASAVTPIPALVVQAVLRQEIDAALDLMNADELKLVMHYINRIKQQKEAA